jgi:hypothetical protein
VAEVGCGVSAVGWSVQGPRARGKLTSKERDRLHRWRFQTRRWFLSS